MPDVIQRAFAGGEISTDISGRADVAKYQTGLKTCRNFIVMRQGGVTRRPGHRFIDEAKDSSNNLLMARFIFNEDQTYLIEVGPQYFRFIRNGAQIVVSGVAAWNSGTDYVVADLVVVAGINYYCVLAHTNHTPPNATYWHALTGAIYEIPTPYLNADLDRLRFTQSGDVIKITHLNYDMRDLYREDHTRWILGLTPLGAAIDPPTGGAGGTTAPPPDERIPGYINLLDFEPFRDGSDDAVALVNFINAVLASENKKGYMPEGIYGCSIRLPDIDISFVDIQGAGKSGIHNVAPLTTGTVIKYIGSAMAPGEMMWKVAPVEGAGNQYLEGLTLKGFTLDGNALAARCFEIRSIRDYDFNFSCFNATEVACYTGVVNLLGDPCDMQDGHLEYCGRQWEANGESLVCDGTPTANVSKATFDVEIVYKNAVAIRQVNSDNNVWIRSRLYGHPARTVDKCWLMMGGDAPGNVVRDEVILDHVGSDPIHAMGTSEGFAYPSYSNRVTYFDEENSGHPDCFVLGTGARAWWGTKDTPTWDGDWEGFPVVPFR
jgi:hypothetical protein